MLEFIKSINSDYAGVLSLLSSLVMVIVTIIYVRHTKRQAYYAKESAELVAKQIKTDKQPCVVPLVIDSYGSAWDASDYTRILLGFTIKLKNVGNGEIKTISSTNEVLDFNLLFLFISVSSSADNACIKPGSNAAGSNFLFPSESFINCNSKSANV